MAIKIGRSTFSGGSGLTNGNLASALIAIAQHFGRIAVANTTVEMPTLSIPTIIGGEEKVITPTPFTAYYGPDAVATVELAAAFEKIMAAVCELGEPVERVTRALDLNVWVPTYDGFVNDGTIEDYRSGFSGTGSSVVRLADANKMLAEVNRYIFAMTSIIKELSAATGFPTFWIDLKPQRFNPTDDYFYVELPGDNAANTAADPTISADEATVKLDILANNVAMLIEAVNNFTNIDLSDFGPPIIATENGVDLSSSTKYLP